MLNRYLSVSKKSGPQGDILEYEIGGNAKDEITLTEVQNFIDQVCCMPRVPRNFGTVINICIAM